MEAKRAAGEEGVRHLEEAGIPADVADQPRTLPIRIAWRFWNRALARRDALASLAASVSMSWAELVPMSMLSMGSPSPAGSGSDCGGACIHV